MASPHKQVNFEPEYSSYRPPAYDPFDTNSPQLDAKFDAATIASRATSGVVAYQKPTTLNALGETEAEEMASSYRSAPSVYSHNSTQDGGLSRQTSSASQARRNMTSPRPNLGDVEEEYTPYSDQGKNIRTDDDDNPLVQNAADMGRSDKKKAMDDLGTILRFMY